jgi:hypothetical protein
VSEVKDYMAAWIRDLEKLITKSYPTAPVFDGFKSGSLRKFLDGWRLMKYDKSSEKHTRAA